MSPAFRFVLVMGAVNLFADMTYEGGGSVNGPFLGSLGASAAAVSILAGLGEFLGYSLRSVAGYVADRTGKYWPVTFIGYGINLLAVPAMALAGHWPLAAAFVLTERVGRAIRKPTVEAMLSYTTGRFGKGWVYAVNTALDETGATLGPLLIALVLAKNGNFRTGYTLLLGPAVLALLSLTAARIVFPLPSKFEDPQAGQSKEFAPSYWLFMTGAALFAAGLMSFELVSFHFSRSGVVTGYWIPLFLAFSTAGGVVANLLFGKLYDRIGMPVVFGAVFVSSLFSPFVFLGSFLPALAGMLLWGIGYATQDTLFKAIVAGLLPRGRRGLAFGLFYTGYGAGWLAGSVATGLLYERSRIAVVVFSVAAQLLSIPILALASRAGGPRRSGT